MKKIISFFIVISIAVFMTHKFLKSTALEAIGLKSHFFSSFKKDVPLDYQYSIPGKKIRFLKFLNTGKNETLRIKKIQPLSKADVIEKMKSIKAQVESVFHPKPAPYFAILTKIIVCPKQFLPRFRKNKSLTEALWMEWVMFANKRKGIGVCNFQSVAFINYKFLKYCPGEKAFFEINYFKPHKEPLPEGQDQESSLLQTGNLLEMDTLIFCSK